MDNWKEILDAYAMGPEILCHAVQGIPIELIDRSLDDQNWTIREIIQHVVEGDDIFVPFIKQALGGLGGHFKMNWYFEQSQIEWGNCWGFNRRDVETALDLYRANRKHTCTFLEGIEKPWEYKLKISWPEQKPIEYTIPDIMNIQIHHLEEHLEEIQEILHFHQGS